MPYHQNGYHIHHRRALGDLVDRSNTWRVNGSWIYANHHDPYILKVSFGLPNHCVCCNVDIEFVECFGAPPQWG